MTCIGHQMISTLSLHLQTPQPRYGSCKTWISQRLATSRTTRKMMFISSMHSCHIQVMCTLHSSCRTLCSISWQKSISLWSLLASTKKSDFGVWINQLIVNIMWISFRAWKSFQSWTKMLEASIKSSTFMRLLISMMKHLPKSWILNEISKWLKKWERSMIQ